MATVSQFEELIGKESANMLYCFIETNELTRRNFGKYLPNIIAKRNQQLGFIKSNCVVRNVSESSIYEKIKKNISEIYAPLPNPNTGILEAAKPKSIIYQLAQGNDVNGINWSEGIYGCGIGKTYDGFGSYDLGTGNTGDVTFDPTTGSVTKNGTVLSSTTTYSKTGNTSKSYQDPTTGITYTTKYNKRKGVWSAVSASDGTNTINPEGKLLSQMDGQMWTNVLDISMTILSQLSDLAGNFASYLSGVDPNAALSPVQVDDGWYEPESNSGLTTAALIGGGLLVGGVVLSQNKSKKRK